MILNENFAVNRHYMKRKSLLCAFCKFSALKQIYFKVYVVTACISVCQIKICLQNLKRRQTQKKIVEIYLTTLPVSFESKSQIIAFDYMEIHK